MPSLEQFGNLLVEYWWISLIVIGASFLIQKQFREHRFNKFFEDADIASQQNRRISGILLKKPSPLEMFFRIVCTIACLCFIYGALVNLFTLLLTYVFK